MSENTAKKAWLATEDGLFFEGRSVGAPGQAIGELVFTTDMVGYQELITDPYYKDKILTFAMTQVGNYGVNAADSSSDAHTPRGIVVREMCFKPSNWRSEESLPDYLKRQGILAIEGIDTRMLVRHVRDNAALYAVISTECGDKDELIAAAKRKREENYQ